MQKIWLLSVVLLCSCIHTNVSTQGSSEKQDHYNCLNLSRYKLKPSRFQKIKNKLTKCKHRNTAIVNLTAISNLFEALKKNDIESIKKGILQKVPVTARVDGLPLLFYAQSEEAIFYMLANGNAETVLKDTPTRDMCRTEVRNRIDERTNVAEYNLGLGKKDLAYTLYTCGIPLTEIRCLTDKIKAEWLSKNAELPCQNQGPQ